VEYLEKIHRASINKNRCFLCGIDLDSKNRSVEHIIPKWIQKEFSLYDKELTLLNGTSIYYKNLTIPCCTECNNYHLNKKCESIIRKAYYQGITSFRKLGDEIIFLWLNKMSYGYLYRELSLRNNLKDENSATIYTKSQIEENEMQFAFLQALRHKTTFVSKAWSMFIYEVEDYLESRFDMRDDKLQHCFLLRIGNIGVIANLQDNETMRKYDDQCNLMQKYESKILTLAQFYELYAHFLTKSGQIRYIPSYHIFTGTTNKSQLGFICNPIMGRAFSEDDYYTLFSQIFPKIMSTIGFTEEDLITDDKRFGTFF